MNTNLQNRLINLMDYMSVTYKIVTDQPHDVLIRLDNGQEIIAIIKEENNKSNKYPLFLLDIQEWHDMLKKSRELNTTPFVIIFYDDGVIYNKLKPVGSYEIEIYNIDGIRRTLIEIPVDVTKIIKNIKYVS